ncbi:RNA polymerase sigma factor [Bacteroidota bacterium]
MSPKSDKYQAVKNFFKREQQKLLLFVRGHLNEWYYDVDAEDIIQDVALSIFSKADFDTPLENLASYVFKSLKNKIIDIYRKPGKKVSIESFKDDNEGNYLLNSIVTDDSFAEYEEDYTIRLEILNEALERLKPEYREIIIETEMNKRSFKELAETWGVSIGTLLSRKHRALARLQTEVEKMM